MLNSFSFYPATGAISEWFNNRRGLALGVAVSGSSVGGIIWPIVLNKLFQTLTDPWVHRIIALISIPLLLVSCILVKERKGVAGHDTAGNQAKPSQTTLSKAILDTRFLFLSTALFFIYCGMLVPFYYIPLYAVELGLDSTTANNLLAIGYAGSFVGRIVTGWFADRIGR
jgi:MFS family permease